MKIKRFTLVIILTILCVFSLPAALISTTGTKPAKGSGSSGNPYEIWTAEELRWFVNYENTRGWFPDDYAKLMCDIDLSTICGPSKGSWIPLGYPERKGAKGDYFGTFYGNGYTIKGLYLDGNDFSKDTPIGFMGFASPYIYQITVEGEIKNPTKLTGGFIGDISCGYPDLNGCISRVKISGAVGENYTVGGLIGRVNIRSYRFDRCMYDGDLSGLTGNLTAVGGLIGNAPERIYHEYAEKRTRYIAVQFCTSYTRCGIPFIGSYISSKSERELGIVINNCITDGALFGLCRNDSEIQKPSMTNILYCSYNIFGCNDSKGLAPIMEQCVRIQYEDLESGKACYEINQLSDEKFCQSLDTDPDGAPYPPTTGHPNVYKVKKYSDCATYTWSYNNTGIDNLSSMPHEFADDEPYCARCHTAVNPDYNSNKEGDYYLLADADAVRWFWSLVNVSGVTNAKARLTADIDMDGVSMQPLTTFSGEINGQGHTLSNVNIYANNQYGGLVGQLKSGGSIHDLTIAGSVTANNCYYVGGFAGLVEDGASLYNLRNDCKVENKVFAFYTTSSYLGGIAGLVRGSIHRCINNGTVIDTSSYYNGSYCIAGVAGLISSSGSFSYLVNNAPVGAIGIYNTYGSAVANHSASSPKGLYYVEIDNPGINYYYGKTASNGATAVTDRKDVGSGKLCYMLNNNNADESEIYFGQSIGIDYVPYPFVNEAHKPVYNNKLYYNCTRYYDYSNVNHDGTPVNEHEYNSDGYCTLCYHADVPQSDDDIYQISTPQHWNNYAKSVNAAYANNALGALASAVLTADITLDASTFTALGNLSGNLSGKGHTVTFTGDPGSAYTLITNVGRTAALSNLNVQLTGASSAIVANNKGNVSACSALDGQIYTDNYGIVTDCYADRAFVIDESGEGYLLRCLQCTQTGSEKQYTVLSKTKGTAECSVKEVFSQAQEETGELAYYISHLDPNQPCVWGEELGTDSHPKPSYGQTPSSDTFVTRLTSYSVEYPDGIIEYMNAGMGLEAVPGCYKVCDDLESWATHPAYNFIVDNGDGTYSAEHINLDPTAQHYLPLEINADRLTFMEADDKGALVAKTYGFGEILSLVFPTEMPVDNINGHVYVFDGYDALNNTLVFTSSLDDGDCVIPANTPVLVRTYGGALLNADLADVTVMPMTDAGYSELENVRHFVGYQQQGLPASKTLEDNTYVIYYALTGEKDNLKATLAALSSDTADQFDSYFRMPYVSASATQNEVNVVLVEDRELKTSRLIERNIFSIPYGIIDDNCEWSKVSHLNDSDHPNIFYGNDIDKDIYANISTYDFLYIHGAPGQKYQFYFNGSDATEVVIDSDGDAFIDLDEHRVGIGDVYLRGIRLADGETVPDDAFAKLYKYLEEGLVLYGYGDFSDDLKGYPFYDATGVKCGISLNLDNPNAIVVGGPNVNGVYNRIVKSEDVMQGFTAERLRLTDGGDFCYDYSVKCPDVAFTRYDVPEQTRYVTFVLPFAVKYVEGMHEYVDCDGQNVYFNTPEDGVIDAYLPIVIDMEEYEGNTITITGEDFVALSPNGVFNVAPVPSTKYDLKYGFVTRRQENVPLDNAEVAGYNIYGFSTTSYKFVRAVNTFSVSPFRAFFMLPKSVAENALSRADEEYEIEALDIVLDGKEIGEGTTGIENVTVGSDCWDGNAYNLMGQPVCPDYRGIVIRNGKKVFIK